jgi:hypothetical protein
MAPPRIAGAGSQLVAEDHRAVRKHRVAFPRQLAQRLALDDARVTGGAGAPVGDGDWRVDAERVHDFVDAAVGRFFAGEDAAPGRAPDRIARDQSCEDGGGVRRRVAREIDALHGRVLAAFIAHEQMGWMGIVRPEHNHVCGEVDCRRYQRHVQVVRHLDGIHAVGRDVGP